VVDARCSSEATGAPFEEVLIRSLAGEHGARKSCASRLRRLPALRTRVMVWDTLAIGEYLAELFPQVRLWPETPRHVPPPVDQRRDGTRAFAALATIYR